MPPRWSASCKPPSAFRDRDGWLKPHQRMSILRKLAALMEGKGDHFAMQIARGRQAFA